MVATEPRRRLGTIRGVGGSLSQSVSEFYTTGRYTPAAVYDPLDPSSVQKLRRETLQSCHPSSNVYVRLTAASGQHGPSHHCS